MGTWVLAGWGAVGPALASWGAVGPVSSQALRPTAAARSRNVRDMGTSKQGFCAGTARAACPVSDRDLQSGAGLI